MDIEERYKYYLDEVCSGQHEPAAVLVLAELLRDCLVPGVKPKAPQKSVQATIQQEPQVVYEGPITQDSVDDTFRVAADALKLHLKIHVQDGSTGG